MNNQWLRFVEINRLIRFGEDIKDIVEINLLLIDEKLSGSGLTLPLGNGSEAMLFRLDNQQLTDESRVPTSVFTTNGVRQLKKPVERSCYLILEQKTLQISVFFSANTTPIGWLVVNALSRPARALAEALVFSYGGNFYMASHRNGKILAKALLNNTKPELVALLSP